MLARGFKKCDAQDHAVWKLGSKKWSTLACEKTSLVPKDEAYCNIPVTNDDKQN